MPRIPRIDLANTVYHVINRSNARVEIFHDKEDYELFETAEGDLKKAPDPFSSFPLTPFPSLRRN